MITAFEYSDNENIPAFLCVTREVLSVVKDRIRLYLMQDLGSFLELILFTLQRLVFLD